VISVVARVLIQYHHCIDGLSSRVIFDFHIIVLLFQRLQSDFFIVRNIYTYTFVDTYTLHRRHIYTHSNHTHQVNECPKMSKI